MTQILGDDYMTRRLRAISAQYFRTILFICITAATANLAAAQTPSLSLSGGSGAPGASVTLTVSLNSNGGTPPAAIEWDFSYAGSVLSPGPGTYYTTGAAASAAGKSATCNVISAGDVRCVVAGLNTTAIGNGAVAKVTFQIAAGATIASSPVALTSPSAADGNGNLVTITAGSATVSILQSATPVPTALACSSSSVTAPTTSTCTVTLNAAPSSNTIVTLSSSTASAVVPASVTVSAGATTATFKLTPSTVSSSTTAVITAKLNNTSKTFSETLLPPTPVPTALACSPSSVTAPATSTCTVTLNVHPTSNTIVTLSSSTASAAVPDSVTVSAGATTATFKLTPSTVSSSTTAVITAKLNNTSKTFSETLLAATSAGAGSLAQIASAGGWNTSLTLANLGTTRADTVLSLYDAAGNPLRLPLSSPQDSIRPTTASTVSSSINPNGLLVLNTTGPAGQAADVGWSLVQASGNVGGYAVFTNTKGNWQAAVPVETLNASSYLLAFDNTGSLSTDVAIANLSPQTVDINVIIRNDSGSTIRTESIGVPGKGRSSFMLSSAYAITAGIRGTIEFDTPTGGQISVLGLRAHGPALTTVPVLAEVSANGGSIAHVTYNGGWQTAFTLVNTGSSATQATMSFFDDDGKPLAMSLRFPQTGAVSTSTTVTKTLDAGASLLMEANGQDSVRAISGSAQLTTTGNVSGFAIFRYNPSQQEAAAPLETRKASAYTVPFENTDGVATGLALANESDQAVNLDLILRNDSGAEIGTGVVPLEAHGHRALVLSQLYAETAGIRGTVEISAPAGSQFSALGLRFTPNQSVTTIPVMAK
jgi:hypothetical protein